MHLDAKKFFTTLDFTPEEIRGLIDYAIAIKAGRVEPALERRVASLLFFNPSVRVDEQWFVRVYQPLDKSWLSRSCHELNSFTKFILKKKKTIKLK